MTEMELIDRLNPRRDLPQVVCDTISRAWEIMYREEVRKTLLRQVEIIWHDLRKNPEDLPKYDVLGDDVSITVLNQNGNKVFYNFIKKLWKLESNNNVSKVIAWCEIPRFKESTE